MAARGVEESFTSMGMSFSPVSITKSLRFPRRFSRSRPVAPFPGARRSTPAHPAARRSRPSHPYPAVHPRLTSHVSRYLPAVVDTQASSVVRKFDPWTKLHSYPPDL